MLKIQYRRLNHLRDFSNSRPNSWNIFIREVPCMAPAIAKATLYCTNSNCSQLELVQYKVVSKHFRGKACLSFFITAIPLLTL